MTTFRTPDGQTYKVGEGQEAKVVDLLRQGMWTDLKSNKKYMERLGDLVAEMFGIAINTEDEKEFLKGLVELKIIDKIQD